MIYQIFLGLFAAAFLFLFYGWYSRTDMPRLIGFLLIFFLGMAVEPALPGSVEYLGNTTALTVDNLTTTVYNYTSYESHTLGFYIMITGVLGFVLIMVDRRQEETDG